MAEKLTFDQFKEKIENTFMQHPVVVDNKYCQWFRDADLTKEEVAAFAVQFSVFSSLFLLACLNRVINAGNLESARETKEILMNELGVIYNNKKAAAPAAEMSDGEVRKVSKDTAKVTIRHGEIKNLDMPPMTMVFQVKDPAMLQTVKVGDKVRFTVENANGAMTLLTLEPAGK